MYKKNQIKTHAERRAERNHVQAERDDTDFMKKSISEYIDDATFNKIIKR
jgi:hypothetical protein